MELLKNYLNLIKSKNIIFVFSVLFFAFLLSTNLIDRYISIDKVNKHWPGWSFLDLILFSKGFLQNDFHVLSNIDTLRYPLAQFLAIFFPNDHIDIILTYIKWNLFVHILISTSFFILVYKILSFKIAFSINRYTSLIIIYFVTFMYIIERFRFALQELNIYLNTPVIAQWKFLPTDCLDPFGLSLIVTNLLSVYLISRIEKNSYKIDFLYIFVLFLIAFIHPVNVLFVLFIISIFFFAEIDLNKSTFISSFKKSIYWKFFTESFLAIGLALLFIKIFYVNDFPFESGELYSIYIDYRHPHHYKPSYYLNLVDWVHFSKNFIVFLFISLVMRVKSRLPMAIFIVGTLSFLLINSVQYLFAEYLQIDSFVLLGISRFLWVYHFCYLCNLCLFGVFIFYYFIKLITYLKLNLYKIPYHKFFISTNFVNSFNILFSRYFKYLILCSFVYAFTLGLIEFKNNYSKYSDFITKQSHHIHHNSFVNFKNLVISNNLSNAIFISGGDISYLRELSLANIFIDGAFSFDTMYIRDWKKRKEARLNFSNCLKKNRSISDECKKMLPRNQQYVVIADPNLLINETPIIQNFYLDKYFVNFYSFKIY